MAIDQTKCGFIDRSLTWADAPENVISQRTGVPEGTMQDWFRKKPTNKIVRGLREMVDVTGIKCHG